MGQAISRGWRIDEVRRRRSRAQLGERLSFRSEPRGSVVVGDSLCSRNRLFVGVLVATSAKCCAPTGLWISWLVFHYKPKACPYQGGWNINWTKTKTTRWLVDLLTCWLVDSLSRCLVDSLTCWLVDLLTLLFFSEAFLVLIQKIIYPKIRNYHPIHD